MAANCAERGEVSTSGGAGAVRPGVGTSLAGAARRRYQERLVSAGGGAFKSLGLLSTGETMKIFVDTGAEKNIVSEAFTRQLKGVQVRPAYVLLGGFGGGHVIGRGVVSLQVTVDNTPLELEAVMVDADLAGADLVIGQPTLVGGDVSVMTRGGRLILFREDDPIEMLSRGIDGLLEPERMRVQVLRDTYIAPGVEKNVPVQIDGATPGDEVMVATRGREESGTVVGIQGTLVMAGADPHVTISNIGEKGLWWTKGQTIARGVLVTPEQASAYMATVSTKSSTGVDFCNVDIGEIGEAERTALEKLLRSMEKCFSVHSGDLGLTNLGEMKIVLESERPVFCRPYRLSQSERGLVRRKVQELLDGGVIRESESEYASPIVLIPKKNGDVRMCVNCRELNRRMVRDRYPLPLIEDQLDQLAGKCYYTTLDLTQGYHQVPVQEESVHKTGFVTPDGHY